MARANSNNLCSPNEDLGTSKDMWVRAFVSTFHTPKCSIWPKSDEKVLTKGLTHIFFDVPKSSFRDIVANKKVALSALGQNGYENRR